MNEYAEKIICPKCKSSMIEYNKKGFGAGKAVLGGLAVGGIGLFAGFIGRNKIKATCLACGNKFNPKDGYIEERIIDSSSASLSPKFPISEKENKQHNTIINMSDEEVEKKFKTWENLLNKGLITKSELNKKKAEFINKRGC